MIASPFSKLMPMETKQKKETLQDGEHQQVYTFRRQGSRWYITYLSGGWSMQDMELTEGADKFLNMLSNGLKKLQVRLSREVFDGSNLLQLVELCIEPKGGGIYLFNPGRKSNSSLFWICDLALLVFGDIPERIYLKRLPLKNVQINEVGTATASC